jgi:uncharacterized damage-inducible protein DinB
MNIQEARALINYNYWARDRVLAAAEALTGQQFTTNVTSSFGSMRDTLVHTLSAECVWLSRWKGEPRPGMLVASDFETVASVRTTWQEEEAKMRAFFETVNDEGLARVIEYRTFNGQPFATPLFLMLQHVVNHGSYHRGQVTTLIRQFGAAPPMALDLIVFYRETA